MFRNYITVESIYSNSDGTAPIIACKFKLIDSEFEEELLAEYAIGGMDLLTPIIECYERKNLNPAVNAALYTKHIAERFDRNIGDVIKQLASFNGAYKKYEKDIQKYFLLI